MTDQHSQCQECPYPNGCLPGDSNDSALILGRIRVKNFNSHVNLMINSGDIKQVSSSVNTVIHLSKQMSLLKKTISNSGNLQCIAFPKLV